MFSVVGWRAMATRQLAPYAQAIPPFCMEQRPTWSRIAQTRDAIARRERMAQIPMTNTGCTYGFGFSRTGAYTIKIVDGNQTYRAGDLWSTAAFEAAWSDWLLTEPEGNGLRFRYEPKGKPSKELLVYNGKLYNTTSGNPVEVVVNVLRLYKI